MGLLRVPQLGIHILQEHFYGSVSKITNAVVSYIMPLIPSVCRSVCLSVCTYVCMYICMYAFFFNLLHVPLLAVILHALFHIYSY